MSALASSSRCPVWCVGHSLDQEFDGSVQVSHERPVVASDTLQADVEWFEDRRDPLDPAYFTEPPLLILTGQIDQLMLPITPETLDQLEQALAAARLTLVNHPALTEGREE